MTNLDKYVGVFKECFSIEDEGVIQNLKYQAIPAWDSIGHMSLVSFLESEFNILIEMDDVIDFSDFQKGKLILKKYGIEI